MLTIRAAQMAELQRDRFHEHLLRHVRTECADAVVHLLAAELDARIAHALAVARGLGFDTHDNALAALVTLLFHAGPQFHWHPALQAILVAATTAASGQMLFAAIMLAIVAGVSAVTLLSMKNKKR